MKGGVRTLGSVSKHCQARARYFIWVAERGMFAVSQSGWLLGDWTRMKLLGIPGF